MDLNIYLFFNGNCEEAMNFYKDTANGSIVSMQRYGDTQSHATEDYQSKILHGVMHIHGTTVMMSDAGEKRNVSFGDNFSLSLNFKSDGDINRTFEAMSAGGTVTMPLQDTFWGATFGMCRDKFGVNWMFNFDKPKAH